MSLSLKELIGYNLMMSKFKRNLGWILISSLIFISISSCGSLIKIIAGIPNLNVYSKEDIQAHMQTLPKDNNIVDTELQSGLQETTIKNFVLMSVPYRTYIYNQKNELLCYDGESYCSITQMDSLRTSSIKDSYAICDSITLDTDIVNLLGDFDSIESKLNLPK